MPIKSRDSDRLQWALNGSWCESLIIHWAIQHPLHPRIREPEPAQYYFQEPLSIHFVDNTFYFRAQCWLFLFSRSQKIPDKVFGKGYCTSIISSWHPYVSRLWMVLIILSVSVSQSLLLLRLFTHHIFYQCSSLAHLIRVQLNILYSVLSATL